MSESLALVVIEIYMGGGDASVAGVAIEGSIRSGFRFQQVDERDMCDDCEPSSVEYFIKGSMDKRYTRRRYIDEE